jgi:hypothetical protein
MAAVASTMATLLISPRLGHPALISASLGLHLRPLVTIWVLSLAVMILMLWEGGR